MKFFRRHWYNIGLGVAVVATVFLALQTWISDKAEFTPKTIQTRDERANLVYMVKIAVKNDGYIKKGMYGEVKLTITN